MKTSKKLDYVVVGGGLIGLAAALRLRRLGWDGVVLEQKQKSAQGIDPSLASFDLVDTSPRVLALNDATVDSLALAGLTSQSLQSLGSPFRGMEVWDRELSGSLSFDARGWIVENHRLEQSLTALVESAGIPILDTNVIQDSRIDSERVWLDCGQENQFEASLLIGADGAESRVRQLLGIPTLKWAYDQRAVVAVVRAALPHAGVTRQWFTQSGPLALLPLRDPHGVVLVWSSSEAESLLSDEVERLEARLERETDQTLGTLRLVSRRQSFPLSQQHAVRYIKGRAVLLGDAAHTIHPLAGQGANLGFADVADLADRLGQMTLDPSATLHSVLAAFERDRSRDNLLMTAVTDGLSRLFTEPKPVWLKAARSWGMRWLDRESRLKQLLTDAAAGR